MSNLFHSASGTVDVQALTSGTLVGYSIRESAATAAAAVVVLRHGTADTDTPIATISLAADGVETANLPAISCPDGIFVERESGETTVSLYTL